MREPALSSSLSCGGSCAILGARACAEEAAPGCSDGFWPRSEDRSGSTLCAPGMFVLTLGRGGPAGGCCCCCGGGGATTAAAAAAATLACDTVEEPDLIESCL